MSGYESEYGKDAWKAYRRLIESIDPAVQKMLHEFGAEMYDQGRANEREAAVRRVAALPTRGGPYSGYTISRDDALAAIRGEGSNGS